MPEVVSFVANVDKPPAPYSRLAVKLLGILLGLPSIACVTFIAFTNTGFLAGGSANWVGHVAGAFGGVASALGLSALLVAYGLLRKDLWEVAVGALILFGACLVLTWFAMGSSAYVASQPMRFVEKPGPRFDAEPRQAEAVERAIAQFLDNAREYRGRQGWTIVANGKEILSRTDRCTSFHFAWEHSQCEEWVYLQAEKAARERLNRGSASDDVSVPGSGAVFSAQQIRVGHYVTSWQSHILILAFAILGFPITAACAYILTLNGVVDLSRAKPKLNGEASLVQETFNSWADKCLQQTAATDTPISADLAYRHFRAFADWTKGRPHASPETFGVAMTPVLARFQATRDEVGKNRDVIYRGVSIRNDGISGQILARLTQA